MDMSLSQESLTNTTDDIWQRHESEIRRLYQTGSLADLKSIMETEHGFPKLAGFEEPHILKLPPSDKTWHEKLGNRRIRKTVTNKRWRKIYRHCAHYRLEDPSRERGDKRLKRLKRPTEVICDGKSYAWDRAWRSMKNAGAISGPQIDPPSPLSPGITVQTPPPPLSSPSPPSSSKCLQPQHASTATLQSRGQLLASGSDFVRNHNTYSGGGRISTQLFRLLEASTRDHIPSNHSSVSDFLKPQMLLQLPGLPIWELSHTMIKMADLDPPSHKSHGEPWSSTTAFLTPSSMSSVGPAIFSETEIANESVCHNTDLFSLLILTQPSSTSATFSTQHKAYLVISMAIYLLSNNHVILHSFGTSIHRGFFETLGSVFAEMPARHLRALLQTRLGSVRAAFEALIMISGELQQRFVFKSLVEIGLNSDWLAISARGHEYLYHAVCMGLDKLVQQLLDSGCRPDKLVRLGLYVHEQTNVIITAFERRNIHYMQMLLKHCDVNSHFRFKYEFPTTSFTFFIEKECLFDETLFGQGIELFINAGADIHSLLETDDDEVYNDGGMWSKWQKRQTWSVLDYLFCFHRRLFHEFAPDWSPAQAWLPTRAGILTSLESGPGILDEYFKRLAQNVGWECLHKYLELLVAEQLTGTGPWRRCPRRLPDLKIVCALLNSGVCMDKVLNRVPSLLADYMEGKGTRNSIDYDMGIIRYLLRNRAVVDGRALQNAVSSDNAVLVALLIQETTDFQQRGADALVTAATTGNHEAAKIILDAGVDINTEFARDPVIGRDQTTSLLCEIVRQWTLSFDDLNNMIDFLVHRGAHFRLSAMKPHLSDMIESVLEYEPMIERDKGLLKRMIQYNIDKGCDLSDPEVPSARLLEACGILYGRNEEKLERMEIFESMFRKGAMLRPGAPLAAWVYMGGGADLANDMLCAGVDIDAYHNDAYLHTTTALQAAVLKQSHELVLLLLEKGADVNAPARGLRGTTALQASCCVDPHSPAEKVQQMSIMNLLLAHGADVNAAPARQEGGTALQEAAARGDLESTMLLLSCTPPADVNSPRNRYPTKYLKYHVALDLAAHRGRLDTVKLLLNNNALSGCPGNTGYDGAIRAAEERGHLAVASLIREHAAAVMGSSTWCTLMSQPQRDWREYGYDNYSDEYIVFYEDTLVEEDDEAGDDNLSDSGDDEDPVARMQVQHEEVQHHGPECTVHEPGWVWDMEADISLDFDIGFGDLTDNVGSTYDLHDAAPNSHIDTASFGWEMEQWPATGST